MAAMGSTARVSHVLCARTCRFLSGRTASSSSSPISPFRGARAAAAADPKIGRRGWQWRAVRARLDVAVRPDTYREELDVKIERARSHFAAAPAPAPAPSNPDPKPLQAIELPPTEVHESARANFRMRAEFRVWHDGDRSYLAMFDSDDPKTPIEVPAFPMGSERINDLMPRFLEEIGKSEVIRRKLFQVNFLTTRKGDALVSMLYHKPVKTDGWAEAAEEMILIIVNSTLIIVANSRKHHTPEIAIVRRVVVTDNFAFIFAWRFSVDFKILINRSANELFTVSR